MTESRINQSLCRLCGCKNENGRSLNDENSAELLSKVQETFSLLIGGNDPLPNRICIQCEQDVNVFYIKIKRFQTLDKKWRDEIQQTNSSHPYLQIEEHYSGEIDKIRKKVDAYMIHEQNHNDLQDPLDSNDVQPIQQNDEVPKEEMASVAEKTTPDIEFEQKQLEKERDKKRRQKRQKFAGYIRSRKLKRRLKAQVEQQVLNPVIVQPTDKNTIPKAEMPYKKYRNDILEIISQNEILVSRTRVNRRTAQPFNYNVISSKPQVCPKKKVTMKKEPAASHDHDVLGPLTEKTKSPQMSLDTSPSIQPRQRRRINYSEELVDEAFMYEQILHDKQKSQEKRKKCIPKVAELTQNINDSMGSVALSVSSPANLDSRLRLLEQRNEISIMPLKSRMMTKDPASKFDSKMPIPLKIEPLFNITSSVSVFKPRKSDQAPSSLQISNITSLHTYRAGPSSKRQKFSCTYCTKTFADEKQLAEHNMDHLHVSLNKIDAVQVLKPKLRRGRMLNLDDNQYIRCVNCWKLHTNNKSILDHWNNGACLFYCMICEKSFHDNIKDLKSHFESEHGVKYRTMLLLKRDPLKNEEPVKKPDSPKQPSMQVNSLMPDLLRKPGPANRKPVHKKPAAGQEPNHLLSGEMRCELCNRTFIHRKAYRAHYTLSHKKKQNFDVSANDGAKQDVDKKAINPMAVASGATKSSKNQKKNFGKNWKKRTNEAVMKTVIRKAPKRHIPVTVSSNKQQPVATRKLVEPMTIGETLVQCTTISTPLKAQNRQDLQVSQDQTVSSTFLPTSAVYNDTDIQIKPEPEAEPMENYPINYPEVPVQSCNGWVQPQQQEQQQEQQHEQQQEQQPPLQPPPLASLSSLPPQPQYDAWNQNVAVDPYLDTSPRLKVKDLTDLQVPNQRHPIESQGYQQNVVYKEQPLIMPNQNMTGLQIQNVQSYQPHPVQPNPIQTYVDYSCMNSMGTSMSTSMTMPEQGMCTSNLYEMHISQAQQVQNTQFINPVFLLPTNSTHAVQDYHY
ncbi:uncharacterized protein LOC129579123 [Sitodiplosis mosellana]|uniref:uncharacterized protein LOC129579123 n=1 Tax=Sitodiplosis mosellana TaxID=263140 RepID=UPI00244510C0|nr:uncharacterized protein LOC129579123 [Sitodiplosis mosellana]